MTHEQATILNDLEATERALEALRRVNKRIEKGMALLTRFFPGWKDRVKAKIETNAFNIDSCYSCAVALAAQQEYHEGLEILRDRVGYEWETAPSYGFSVGAGSLESDLALIVDDEISLYSRRWEGLTLAWEWLLAMQEPSLLIGED